LLLNSKLLNNWDGKGIKLLSELVQDIEHMAHRIGLDRGVINQQLFSCRGITCVQRIHDKLVEQLNNKIIAITTRNQDSSSRPSSLQSFPISPLPNNVDIISITNTTMLIEESRLQHHCVAAYNEEIIRGEYYIYQILAPERATLSIHIRHTLEGQVRLRIDQLKGYGNKTVDHATKKAVLLWFNQATHSQSREEEESL
jgi:hypothetical protein